MAKLTDTKIDAALERGRLAEQREPRAETVRYDRRSSRIIMNLTNGCTFVFPRRVWRRGWRQPVMTN